MKKSLVVMAAMAVVGIVHADDFARVVASTPVMEQVAVPRQVCQQQEVQAPASKSGLGAILGGVAGAALGNQVGRGGGRTVATAVGAIGGAVLGNNIEGTGPGQVQTVQNCHTETTYENRIKGYDVRYDYAGREYTVQMPYDPGSRLKVRVVPVI